MKTRVTIWELCVFHVPRTYIICTTDFYQLLYGSPVSSCEEICGPFIVCTRWYEKWCKPTATSDLFISPINLIHLCKQWARGGGANSSESVSAVTMYSRYTKIYGAVYLLGKRWCETHMKATKTGSVCDGDMCCESMKTGLVDIIWNCICSKLNAS